jgi:hypothetical protein
MSKRKFFSSKPLIWLHWFLLEIVVFLSLFLLILAFGCNPLAHLAATAIIIIFIIMYFVIVFFDSLIHWMLGVD